MAHLFPSVLWCNVRAMVDFGPFGSSKKILHVAIICTHFLRLDICAPASYEIEMFHASLCVSGGGAQ